MGSLVGTSQRRMVLSALAVASFLPSGEKFTEFTGSPCASRTPMNNAEDLVVMSNLLERLP